jgi:hypothetical protein
MKQILLISLLMLAGCSTPVPLTAKFPEAPEMLKQKCPPLQQVKEDAKLSELSTAITNNYTSYHECAVLVNGWNDWYNIQKNIYEKIGK